MSGPSYARTDIESIALDVKRQLLDPLRGINNMIDEINIYKSVTDLSDYGRYIALLNVNETNGIFFVNVDFSTITMNPWVGIQVTEQAADEMGGKTVKVLVRLSIDDPADGFINERALRYLQALEDVFERNRWSNGLKYSRMIKLNPHITLAEQAGKNRREVSVELECFYPMW